MRPGTPYFVFTSVMSSTLVTFVAKPATSRCFTQLAQHPQVGLLKTSTVCGCAARCAAARPASERVAATRIAMNAFLIPLLSPLAQVAPPPHPPYLPDLPYFASALGRIWNLTTLLVIALSPSVWNGARVAQVDHR